MMKRLLYRCPKTGDVVQRFIADEPDPGDEHRYDAVECPACSSLHFINPVNGKVMGDL
jgi:DNA-directed RNA polymerase subunit RPC12/RpoP